MPNAAIGLSLDVNSLLSIWMRTGAAPTAPGGRFTFMPISCRHCGSLLRRRRVATFFEPHTSCTNGLTPAPGAPQSIFGRSRAMNTCSRIPYSSRVTTPFSSFRTPSMLRSSPPASPPRSISSPASSASPLWSPGLSLRPSTVMHAITMPCGPSRLPRGSLSVSHDRHSSWPGML